jgi:hypothetical protein
VRSRLAGLIALATAVLTATLPATAFADGPEMGIDATTEGNSATAVGTVEGCVEASEGDTVEVDLYVKDLEDVLTWQVDLRYDPAVLEVTERSVIDFFLASAEDANVVDLSLETPDSDGRYSLAALNANDSPAGASGSGVIAHITFTAIGSGVSELDLTAEDFNDDGANDFGVFARQADGDIIGDDDGDSYFDGTLRNGAIAVDESCEGVVPLVSGGDDDFPVLLVIIGVAVAAGLATAGALLIWRRRHSSGNQTTV